MSATEGGPTKRVRRPKRYSRAARDSTTEEGRQLIFEHRNRWAETLCASRGTSAGAHRVAHFLTRHLSYYGRLGDYISTAYIAERVQLSRSATYRAIKHLEALGVIAFEVHESGRNYIGAVPSTELPSRVGYAQAGVEAGADSTGVAPNGCAPRNEMAPDGRVSRDPLLRREETKKGRGAPSVTAKAKGITGRNHPTPKDAPQPAETSSTEAIDRVHAGETMGPEALLVELLPNRPGVDQETERAELLAKLKGTSAGWQLILVELYRLKETFRWQSQLKDRIETLRSEVGRLKWEAKARYQTRVAHCPDCHGDRWLPGRDPTEMVPCQSCLGETVDGSITRCTPSPATQPETGPEPLPTSNGKPSTPAVSGKPAKRSEVPEGTGSIPDTSTDYIDAARRALAGKP